MNVFLDSGKSLVYQIPVLQALQTDRDARAMYVFPTKALAQDQKRALQELLSAIPCLQNTQVQSRSEIDNLLCTKSTFII